MGDYDADADLDANSDMMGGVLLGFFCSTCPPCREGVGQRGKHPRGRYRPARLDTTRVPSESFGALLRAYRRTTGQSLGAFADAHGLSVLYLSDVERGLQVPSPRLRAIYSAGIMRDCK